MAKYDQMNIYMYLSLIYGNCNIPHKDFVHDVYTSRHVSKDN